MLLNPADPSPDRYDCDTRPVFQALIKPHRSLSRRGTLILMAVLIMLTGLVGLRMWLFGAWPVMLFSSLEIPLAAVLLAINRAQADARESITLSPSAITVVRTDHRGRRSSFSLPSAWLQVHLETMESRGSRLVLRSHGSGREVGAFLHEPEKRSLFEALRDALSALRNPVVDNQQLREG
jgi:uncharacterized membrane protein